MLGLYGVVYVDCQMIQTPIEINLSHDVINPALFKGGIIKRNRMSVETLVNDRCTFKFCSLE